jgi:hypothetical protein
VLSVFNPAHMVSQVLPSLISQCLDKALHVRHGAILGVAEVVIGLSGNSSINRKNVLEKAFKGLSNKEKNIILDET